MAGTANEDRRRHGARPLTGAKLPYGYISRAAKLAGVSKQAVQQRIAHGWPLHALHFAHRPDEQTDLDQVQRLAEQWGLLKPTISELAREAGLQPYVVHGRIAIGWSQKRALATPLKQQGVQPGSLRDRFDREAVPGVYLGLVLMRVYGRGWTLDRALTTPVQSRGSPGGRRKGSR